MLFGKIDESHDGHKVKRIGIFKIVINKLKLTQKGFSLTIVLVSIVIVIVIGAGAWYVASRGDKNASSTTQPGKTTSQNKTEPKKVNPVDITVKEWGVKVTFPAELNGDISYFMNHRAEEDFGGPVILDFVSQKFSSGNLMCADIEGDIPRSLVGVERQLDSEGVYRTEPAPFKTIGEARYYISSPTACEEAIAREGTASDKKLLADLKKAIVDTLVPIN